MFQQRQSSTERPLPLKQRTSSLDTRRDYTSNTWRSLLVLLKLREYFVTVDNFSIWRRHLAWSMENGQDLRAYMTQRYASNMVFMSLLLSTEMSILFNSAQVTNDVRLQLQLGNHNSVQFWAGYMIIVSALLTLLSLISTFTAWAMVNSVDENNAHCLFRSSIGQYAAELPGRFIVCSIYSFLLSFMLFFFLLLPVGIWSLTLLVLTLGLFVHVVGTFSSFGRVIMHSGAMGKERIFEPQYEKSLLPHTLHAELLKKAKANLANNTSITRQYRRKQKPIDRPLLEEELYDHLSGRNEELAKEAEPLPYRRRADSTVRFEDEEQPPGSYPHHFRHSSSLTPISDTSVVTQIPTPTSSTSMSRKNFAFSEDRPSLTPPILDRPPPSSFNTNNSNNKPRPLLRPNLVNTNLPMPMPPIQSVSSSSLEQWLQASPMSTDDLNSKRGGVAAPNSTNSKQEQQRAPPTPPPPTQVMTWAAGSLSSAADDRLVLSDRRLSDRDLTEDERFAMDYGDDLLPEDTVDSKSDISFDDNIDDDEFGDTERARLLEPTSFAFSAILPSTNYGSSKPTTTTAVTATTTPKDNQRNGNS
jgi:hypothetical protein